MAKRYRPRDACMTSYGWAAADGYQSMIEAITDANESPDASEALRQPAGARALAGFALANRGVLREELGTES